MHRAFTLIELLLVIAIVGILASLMVPALSDAHAVSQTTVCKNNQRILALASASYFQDNGTFPPAFTKEFIAWDDESILWQYLDQKAEMMRCPKHSHDAYSETGYNYNTSFIGDEGYITGIVVQGVQSSNCKHPAHCAMFGDSSNNKFMRSPNADETYDPYTDAYTRCAGMQSFRHNDKSVVAWLDGHVTAVSDAFNICNEDTSSGFLSADNTLYDPRVMTLD